MTKVIRREEHRAAMLGVSGRMMAATVKPGARAGTFTSQRWVSERRPYKGPEYAAGATIQAFVRFDDQCGNGHNDFSITAEIREPRQRDISAGGCLHAEIRRYFPELAPLIKWHLTSTDGPMHYVANTVYLAGDRDHNGHRAGEPCRWEQRIFFADSPVGHTITSKLATFIQQRAGSGDFVPVAIQHKPSTPGGYDFKPKYTPADYTDSWAYCPWDTEAEAAEWCEGLNSGQFRIERQPVEYSQGKARELDSARRAAVWPEATDEQLSVEREQLEAVLLERLPALLADFRADIEAAGFLWAPECLTTEGEA